MDTSSIREIRSLFVKDHSLPIQVLETPHFENLLSLYGDMRKNGKTVTELWMCFCSVLSNFSTAEQYLDYRKQVLHKIVSSMKATQSFKKLETSDMSIYQVPTSATIQKFQVFKPENNTKPLVSVDLRQANFQAISDWDARCKCSVDDTMLKGCPTYTDFLLQYTADPHLHSSKFFRQLIFGLLFPEKQAVIQRWLLHQELKKLPNDLKLLGGTADEAIFMDPLDNAVFKYLDMSRVRVERFVLHQIKMTPCPTGKTCFVRSSSVVNSDLESFLNEPEMRSVPSYIAAQVYRQIFNKPKNPSENVAYLDGLPCVMGDVVVDQVSCFVPV
jgi:hypothetical protein